MPLYTQRMDTAATLLGNDGDVGHGLIVDASGKLWTVPGALSAGEAHIGSVGGRAAVITIVPSLHTDANVANDVLAATEVIALALRVNDGTGVIQSVVVQDDDDNAGDLDLVFFSANTSVGAESAEVDMADNDTILGVLSVVEADYTDMIDSQFAAFVNVGIVIVGATGTDDIYMAIISRDTDTYSATGLTVRLGILQD